MSHFLYMLVLLAWQSTVSSFGLHNKALIPLLSSLTSATINVAMINPTQHTSTGSPIAQYSALVAESNTATSTTSTATVAAVQPTDKDNQMVQIAFRDFDLKRFEDSEKEFTTAIIKWKELHRPRDEIVSLLKARANVRVDFKKFDAAKVDYDEALELMRPDGMVDNTGRARYPEYPDTFVGRALAKEGLADWTGALADYDEAVKLWGGSTSDQLSSTTKRVLEGINPYVLTFRGNTLARLNQFEKALIDYGDASDIFIGLRDINRYSDARANYALTLYQLDRPDEAVKVMRDVIRKNPGYADMYVAIAADSWSKGDYVEALKNWRFVCDRIEVGCDAYKDTNWVSTVRRWPPSLVTKLNQFLNRELPEALKGKPGQALAPAMRS